MPQPETSEDWHALHDEIEPPRSRPDVFRVEWCVMARFINQPTRIEAHGQPPKTIEEFVGRVNSGTAAVSIARMVSPSGWSEPGQTPEFSECTIVLRGTLHVETKAESFDVHA